MRFISSRQTLRAACDTLARVVPRKDPMPVLQHVRATLAGNVLTLAGTDLTMSLAHRAEVKGLVDGEALLPLHKLAELVKVGPDVPLEVEANDVGRVTLRSLNSFDGTACNTAQLSGEELRNYPKLPDPASSAFVSLPVKTLARALAKTLPFVSRDELRPQLTGLRVEIKPESLRVVSTDGHRMAHYTAFVQTGADVEFIMEGACARALAKLLAAKDFKKWDGNLTLAVEIGKKSKAVESISVSLGNWILTSNAIEGRYPNYADVIPDHSASGKLLTVDRAQLTSVVERAVRIANEVSHQVVFNLNGRCTVSVEDIEQGNEASEEFAAHWSAGDFRIGFNASYLLDALKALGKDSPEVEWSFSEPACASILAPTENEPGEELFYLLMPVRLERASNEPDPDPATDEPAAAEIKPDSADSTSDSTDSAGEEPFCEACLRNDCPTYLVGYEDARPTQFLCRDCIPADAMPLFENDLEELTAPEEPNAETAESSVGEEPFCELCLRNDCPTYLVGYEDARPAQFLCRDCIPPDAVPVFDEDLNELDTPHLIRVENLNRRTAYKSAIPATPKSSAETLADVAASMPEDPARVEAIRQAALSS